MMKASLSDRPGSSKPIWHEDASARLKALLPEMLTLVVAAACQTSLNAYSDGSDVVSLVVLAVVVQLVVQPMLYACTYLLGHKDASSFGLLFSVFVIYSLSFALPEVGVRNANMASMSFAVPTMGFMGMVIFYFTRIRWTFVLLALAALSSPGAFGEHSELLGVQCVAACALVALFIIRSSATRITIATGFESRLEKDLYSKADGQRMFAQVAALGAAVGAICLAFALVGTLPFGGEASSSVQNRTPAGETEILEMEPMHTADVPVSAPVDLSGDVNPFAASLPSIMPVGLSLSLLPLLVALPFGVRLLLRKRARWIIEREPKATDRTGRLYIAILSRLEAAGIERDEAHTPWEFAQKSEAELEELFASSDVGSSDWLALTNAYEKARYGDIDPTEPELATCWKIFDALPVCARKSLGLPRYLVSVFWRM